MAESEKPSKKLVIIYVCMSSCLPMLWRPLVGDLPFVACAKPRARAFAFSLCVRLCSELKRRAKADKKAKEKEAKKVSFGNCH